MKKVSENLDCVINYANKDSENMCDEPECIKQWNASFCERIRIKDETERAKITEMQEKGMQVCIYLIKKLFIKKIFFLIFIT